ncbi:MAG: OpgC domain-containing protein [Proteobacteria bacterium]|nr:OpgC domain-containing protein [Pseudomonadota bacterium]
MTGSTVKAGRDPRLDFFRGFALCIILYAHMRWSLVEAYIPAQFGFSDAAHMFVFMSGCAAAIAFGGVFRRSGMFLGTARIVYRCWQLYLAHLMVFFVVAALAALGNELFARPDYIELMYIPLFFSEPAMTLVQLFALSYVPPYLDIMPMYMVVLAMVPVAVLLARVRPWLAPAGSVLLYLLANWRQWNFLADPSDGRGWFLDPLAWQLIFFTGFTLVSGWLKPPPLRRWLFWSCVAVLVVSLLVKLEIFYEAFAPLTQLHDFVAAHTDKTFLDPFAFGHFLALAYATNYLLAPRLHWLKHPIFNPVMVCGQQALAMFLFGLVLSDLGGMAFDQLGDDWSVQISVNVIALALQLGGAYLVAWFKSTPWRRPAARVGASPAPAMARPGVPAEAGE